MTSKIFPDNLSKISLFFQLLLNKIKLLKSWDLLS